MGVDLIMKRGAIFVLLGVLLLSFFVAKLDLNKMQGFSISEGEEVESEVGSDLEIKLDKNKISSGVLERVEKEDNIRVMIKLKSRIKKGKSIASKSVKEEISDILGEKIRHKFDDKISAFVSEEELLELQNNSNVEFIQLVGSRTISLQDSVPIINASDTWNLQIDGINLTGEYETICIIDTGVNYSHADLGGCYGNNSASSSCKVIGGWDYCADDSTCTTSDSDPMDSHWHGTHVSGIAAANGSIKGVAPGAKLIVIKAANSTGTFWDDDLEKAIDWCVSNASTFNISVISMSLGGGLYSNYCNNDPLNDSINSAIANNISVIVASGNDASTSQISGPACHVNATPVGGTDKSDGMYSNGNRNSLVLLLAPGVSINSTYITGTYGGSSGTSMSTPHVAGAFAIINQYRRLEGSAVMTPSDIEDALNDSGKIISDGGSGLDFSRIKIYQTLKDIDEGAPSVTLVSPSDNYLNSSGNQIFDCSATDALQLANLTFYIWNSSGDLINETSLNAINNTLDIEVDLTLENGTYQWNCLGYDNKSNSGWASENYTTKIGEMLMTLNSPSDNLYITTNSTTFNCTIQDSVADLTNVTLYVWNSSNSLSYNETVDISGSANETTFDYNISSEDDYEWNCFAFDEHSNSISGNSNYTITYDSTNPLINLEGPEDDGTSSDSSVTFEYNVSDSIGIKNCTLILNDDLNESDGSVTKDTTQEIDVDLGDGSYDWKIRCYDNANNMGESEEWELAVDTGSGSGGSDDDDDDDDGDDDSIVDTTYVPSTYNVSDESFEEGFNKYMREGDKLKFNKSGEVHTLKLDTIAESEIKIKVSSDTITLVLKLLETEKVNLNDDKTYDLEVSYEEFRNLMVKIKIKSINEEIPTREIADNETPSDETIGTGTGHGILSDLNKTTKIIIGIIVGAAMLAGIGFWIYKKNDNILGPVFKKKYKRLIQNK